jgi:hypothetical protein
MPQPGAREAKSAALSLEKHKFSISKGGYLLEQEYRIPPTERQVTLGSLRKH